MLCFGGEAARRMVRGTLKYRLHENHVFLNSPHTSVREKRIGREKYTRQSNEMWKVGGIQNTQVLWQAVFLAASPLAKSLSPFSSRLRRQNFISLLASPLKLYFARAYNTASHAG